MNYYPAAKIINDTDTHTGRFGCIKPLQDSVINTIQGPNILGDLSTLQFKTNTSIEGVITSISLTSGTVIAYRL
tara:strand:- start:453 stop:674 length:222 start_codon:yes stop_codon:yes gene_type:complete